MKTTHHACLLFFLLFPVCLGFPVEPGAEADPAPAHDPTRDFDFWIGEWEVTVGDQLAGRNRIEPIVGGRALKETWTGAGGTIGTSTNIYDGTTATWKQFWVDNSGLVLFLEGGIKDGKMVLSGKRIDRKGRPVLDRITWTPRVDGTVRQVWEMSTDGGDTWTVGFDGLYEKARED